MTQTPENTEQMAKALLRGDISVINCRHKEQFEFDKMWPLLRDEYIIRATDLIEAALSIGTSR